MVPPHLQAGHSLPSFFAITLKIEDGQDSYEGQDGQDGYDGHDGQSRSFYGESYLIRYFLAPWQSLLLLVLKLSNPPPSALVKTLKH